MNEFPFGYESIAPVTWAFWSALLVLTLFFKFNRFWSFRNLDLVLLILLSPGLVMVMRSEGEIHRIRSEPVTSQARLLQESELAAPAATNATTPTPDVANRDAGAAEQKLIRTARSGYIWLFSVGALFLIRLLLDPLLIRRPLLEPNLTKGGLIFLACCQLILISAHILQSNPAPEELAGTRQAFEMVQGRTNDISRDLRQHGPGLGIFHLLPVFPSFFVGERILGGPQSIDLEIESIVIAKLMAIVLQIVICIGFVYVGKRHFRDTHIGLGMATLHLLSPYTAQFAGHVLHILPAAILIWSIAMYRRPVVAGILIGLVAGVTYYPLFLLPLWFSFYWERGAARFAYGLTGAIVGIILVLFFAVPTWSDFLLQIRSMFGFWLPKVEGLTGIWRWGWDAWFRLPILVGFIGLAVSFVFWPARKNLGTLIAYSGAIMVAVQFWHGHIYGGGLMMAWYVPLALMTFFRPNLDEFTAGS